jgi:hypothetical protein
MALSKGKPPGEGANLPNGFQRKKLKMVNLPYNPIRVALSLRICRYLHEIAGI